MRFIDLQFHQSGGLLMVNGYELADSQWARIAPLLPGKAGEPGRSGADNRLFVNGVLWVLRSGAHWRDLPERSGKCKNRSQAVHPLGHRGDATQARALLVGLRADHVLTDKACDSNALRGFIANMGAQAVIPCNRTRKKIDPL